MEDKSYQLAGYGLIGELKSSVVATKEEAEACMEAIRHVMVQYKINYVRFGWEGPWSWSIESDGVE